MIAKQRREPGRRRLRNKFKLSLLGGGSGLALADYVLLNPWTTDLVIAVDVPSELEKRMCILSRLPRHQKITLGRRVTTDQILRKELPPDHVIFSEIGTADGHAGMAQRPAIASIAAKEVLDSRQWEELVEYVIDSAIQDCGEQPEGYELSAFFSLSGAAGGGAAPVLITDLGKQLATTESVVSVNLHCLDNIAFTGLGRNVHSNAHVAIRSLTESITSRQSGNRTPNQVWNLFLSSLPAGMEPEVRKSLHLQAFQAWECQPMQDKLQVELPNYNLRTLYGNITLVTQGFFNEIPASHIASFVSIQYQSEMRKAIEGVSQNLDSIKDFTESFSTRDLDTVPVAKVIERTPLVGIQNTIDSLSHPESSRDFDYRIETLDGRELKIDTLPSYFATIPQTFSEALDSLKLVNSIHYAIDIQTKVQTASLSKVVSIQQRLKTTVHQLVTKFHSKPRARKRLQPRLLRKANDFRQLLTRESHLRESLATLEKSKALARAEMETQRKRLKGVINLLDQHVDPNFRSPSNPLVEFRSLDDSFAGLLDATFLDQDTQRAILCASVTAVTLHGLASIVGSDTIAIESIVDCIVGANSSMQSCWPGGWQREEDTAAFVLPPLSIQNTMELRAEIARRDSKAARAIYIGTNATVGCNVIRFGLVHPDQWKQIASPMAEAAFNKANNAPGAMLSSWESFNSQLLTNQQVSKLEISGADLSGPGLTTSDLQANSNDHSPSPQVDSPFYWTAIVSRSNDSSGTCKPTVGSGSSDPQP